MRRLFPSVPHLSRRLPRSVPRCRLLRSLLPLILASPLSAQTVSRVSVLRAEYERAAPAAFRAAVVHPDPAIRRLAIRALGRLENAVALPILEPLLRRADARDRIVVVEALAQIVAARSRGTPDFPWCAALNAEREPTVRGAIYAAWGRTSAADTVALRALANGLGALHRAEQHGAATGVESLLRRHSRTFRLDSMQRAQLTGALHQLLKVDTRAEVRQLALLAMTSLNDRDVATVDLALRDSSAQVRRVAVALGRRWLDDPAPMVRWQALRVAGTCARAAAALRDTNEHVVLLSIALLGDSSCASDAMALTGMLESGATWRMRAHALVALARVAPALAHAALPAMAASPTWQARVYAATAARQLNDTVTLQRLARDVEPNVAMAAMRTTDDAIGALTERHASARDGTHAGLLLEAAIRLKGDTSLVRARPALLSALTRLASLQRVTLRDPRVAILERLAEIPDRSMLGVLRSHLADRDPEVAARAAALITRITGTPVAARTTRYVPEPFDDRAARASSTSRVQLRVANLGTLEITLHHDLAPMATQAFLTLARADVYTGRTFHRIVPNFVVQGGSPGADEYDPATDYFMRDEVGGHNLRGTLGISTRGRDTGDGQLYINLVDNFRLDHDYTVFATITAGLDLIDRIQEGDVIEAVSPLVDGERRRARKGESAMLRGARQPAYGPGARMLAGGAEMVASTDTSSASGPWAPDAGEATWLVADSLQRDRLVAVRALHAPNGGRAAVHAKSAADRMGIAGAIAP